MTSLAQLLTNSLFLAVSTFSASAQGTFSLGFEDVPIDGIPHYIIKNPLYTDPAVVMGTGVIGVPAYEGAKTLGIWREAGIRSPDSSLIQSFSLRLYVPASYKTPPPGGLYIGAGNAVGDPELSGSWQELRGTFEVPVQEFAVYSYVVQGQIIGAYFAIDALELQTVPEPSTIAIVGIGVGAFLLRRRRQFNVQT